MGLCERVRMAPGGRHPSRCDALRLHAVHRGPERGASQQHLNGAGAHLQRPSHRAASCVAAPSRSSRFAASSCSDSPGRMPGPPPPAALHVGASPTRLRATRCAPSRRFGQRDVPSGSFACTVAAASCFSRIDHAREGVDVRASCTASHRQRPKLSHSVQRPRSACKRTTVERVEG